MTDDTRRHLRAATIIWMVAVAASRLAGLVREMVIARVAGADGHTDVYFTAFTLPDFLNYLLAGGALSVTFIPIFLGFLLRKEDERAWRVFNSAFQLMLVTLAVLLLLGWLAAPLLCRWIAPGFDPEQHRLLVRYTRILLPAQLCFFAGGLFGAVQMARGRHGLYASAAIVYNVGIIAGGLLLGPVMGMEGFCWGALAGAVIGHGVMQYVGAARAGLRLVPAFDWTDPSVRLWLKLTLPFMIGQSILATDDWLQRFFGSDLSQASISWLNYGKKLVLVLPAVLGQASAVASFPLLAQQAETGELGTMRATLTRALERSLLLSGLGAVLFIALNREAVQVVFGHGRFTTADVLTTGRVVAILAVSAPALVAQAILVRGYYALRDTATPTIIGTLITLGAIPLYVALARWFDDPVAARGGGHLGLAWGSTLALLVYGVLTTVILQRGLDRRDPAAGRLVTAGFLVRAIGVLGVTLAAAALLRGAVGGWLPDMAFLPAIGRSILVGVPTVLVFLLACRFGGVWGTVGPLLGVFDRFSRR